MNCTRARDILQSLNPGIGFEVGDVNRLPLFRIANANEIFRRIEAAFTIHESHREPSVEFKQPGPSPWRHAQDSAQLAVDRAEGAALPEYVEELDPEPPTDHVSFAVGVALGQFRPHSEGVLDPAAADLAHSPPHGILFLDGTLTKTDLRDSLGHPASQGIAAAWEAHGPAITRGKQRSRHAGLAAGKVLRGRPPPNVPKPPDPLAALVGQKDVRRLGHDSPLERPDAAHAAGRSSATGPLRGSTESSTTCEQRTTAPTAKRPAAPTRGLPTCSIRARSWPSLSSTSSSATSTARRRPARSAHRARPKRATPRTWTTG